MSEVNFIDDIIMRIEVGDSRPSQEAENIDIVILSSQLRKKLGQFILQRKNPVSSKGLSN